MSIATRLPSTRPRLEPNAATCGRQVLPAATRPAALMVAVAISISASACADIELGCGGDVECEGDVRVATWWWDDTGKSPPFLEPLGSSFKQLATGTLEHVPSPTKEQHMALVHDSMDAGSDSAPLDAALFNNGEDVLRMTECASLNDDGGEATVGRLRALDDHFQRDWFTNTYFFSDLVTTLTCHKQVYGLPIGIHRINHVVYNRRLFEEAKQDPLVLADLDQLLAAAQSIQGVLDGKGDATASVFAIPPDDPALPDALSLFFIENVMLAAGGDAKYLDYWAGCPGREPLFGVALGWVSRLSPYFNRAEDARGRTPLQRVLDGNAAMFVTGDWIMADALQKEELVGSMPFPGTQEYWVYTADVFALPSNGNAHKGLAWLKAISAPSAQDEFAEEKGALPARLDIDIDIDVDPRSTGNLIRALPALRDGAAAFDELGQRLKHWASESFGDVTSLVDYAASEYPLLTERRAEGSGAAASRPCSEVIP